MTVLRLMVGKIVSLPLLLGCQFVADKLGTWTMHQDLTLLYRMLHFNYGWALLKILTVPVKQWGL